METLDPSCCDAATDDAARSLRKRGLAATCGSWRSCAAVGALFAVRSLEANHMRAFRLVCCALPLAVLACGKGTFNANGGKNGNGGKGGNGGNGGPAPTCVNNQCQQSCPNGGTTTLTGKVYAPNGTLPLYDAIVYVPSEAVAPFTQGASCNACDGKVSGNPIVTTLTGPDGSFTLNNVPVGQQIPLVVQIGKWRRQAVIPVTACQVTAVDAVNTRLPANQSEGDIPQMAIATGKADPLECLLLKMGLDRHEITAPASNGGRVHFYTATDQPGTDLFPPAPTADRLYSSLQNLLNYDIVMLPCEGAPFDKGSATGLFVDYLNMGGRLFTTHYSYDWLTYANSPFNVVGNWDLNQMPNGQYPQTPYPVQIDTSFAKGMAFSQWMQTVAGVQGTFDVLDPRNDLDAVNPQYSTRWVSHPGDDKVLHMTFNTPLQPTMTTVDNAPLYCGRVVFSDFHVSAAEVQKGNNTFPGACIGGALTAQEKALLFMLFDLSSCVQPDSIPPAPPVI
jgi:hypothetical protein